MHSRFVRATVALLALCAAALASRAAHADDLPAVTDLERQHLANLRQVTFGLSQAGEGYFSPDGEWIVYQAIPVGYPFYQIYVQRLDERTPLRISPGRGRTTCAYFHPDGERILFSSSHTDPDIEHTERKARAEAVQGGRRRYEWVFDPHMEIYVTDREGGGMTRLTDSPGYDAEANYSADGRWIVFTSTRDGDPELYVMRSDGSGVRRLTNAKGYDGGPFFSPDGRWIIFRTDRKEKDMLQIHAISFDGRHEVVLTDEPGTVNWAPYFHPGGKYIIWTRADYSRGPQGANFDLFTMEIEYDDTTFRGGKVERVTSHPKADVLPVFSPDGKKLMWTSTRGEDGTSQLWIADWLRQ